MSAPREVWVTWILGDDGKPFAVDANKAMRLDGDVRYLRADLVDDLIAAGEAMRVALLGADYREVTVNWTRALAAMKEEK